MVREPRQAAVLLDGAKAPSGSAKRGDQVAARLEWVIRTKGWPAGHYLGHEEQLSRDFGASRAVIREAIAIAEWNGIVESRRGREGGLYVRERSLDPTVAALRNTLFLSGAGLDALLRARRLIEGRILELATERMSAADAVALGTILTEPGFPPGDRAHLSRLKQIVDRLSELAGDPLLRLFGGALRHCFVDRVRTTTLDDQAYLRASRSVARCRMQQIEAMLQYDRGAVRDLQTRAMDIWEAFVAEVPPARLSGAAIVERLTATGEDALIYEFVRPAKKAEAAARAIAQGIADKGFWPGDRIGTEAELMAQLGVSRRVFREGVRVLERFGIVEPGRGKLGGLMVGQPERAVLIGSIAGDVAEQVPAECLDEETLPVLLLAAVRRIVAQDQPCRDVFVRAATARRLALPGLAALLASHGPDTVTGCLIDILLDVRGLKALQDLPIESDALTAFLNAVAAADEFGAPRLFARMLKRREHGGPICHPSSLR